MDHYAAVGIATKITARSIWMWECEDPLRRADAVRLLVLSLPRYDREFRNLSEALVQQVLERFARRPGLARRALTLISGKPATERSNWNTERGAAALAVLASHSGAFAACRRDAGPRGEEFLRTYIVAQFQHHEAELARSRSRRCKPSA